MAMPMFEEAEDEVPTRSVEVWPSAVLELTWLVHCLLRGHAIANLEAARVSGVADEVRDGLDELWAEYGDCLPDTSILAERLGALLTDEADTFLDGLQRAATMDDAVVWELRSESPEVRRTTLQRLERLRRGAGPPAPDPAPPRRPLEPVRAERGA